MNYYAPHLTWIERTKVDFINKVETKKRKLKGKKRELYKHILKSCDELLMSLSDANKSAKSKLKIIHYDFPIDVQTNMKILLMITKKGDKR